MHQPAIILVEPQLGENIGMVTRAMWNCSLEDLRLVKPRDRWLNEHTIKSAAGAGEKIKNIRVFNSTEEAIADLKWVFATTARQRSMEKKVLTAKQAVDEMYTNPDEKMGILFGRERFGLHNDDIALANAIIEIPLNPEYCSLNLAQAVLLCAYEWYQRENKTETHPPETGLTNPVASKENMVNFFEHLEEELDKTNFFLPEEKKPKMVRNLRNMFQHMRLSEQDVRTLRGVISALTFHKNPPYTDK